MGKSFWLVWGDFLGYPTCCTTEMLHHYVKNPKGAYGQDVGKRKLNGSGFIPCHKCNKLSERHLIIKINKQRKYSKDFPLNNFDEMLTEALNSSKLTTRQKKLLQITYKD